MENAIFLHIEQRSQIIWRLIFRHIIASCSSFRKDQKSEAFYGKIDRFWSIYDVRRYRNVDFDFYLENGAICSAYQTQNIL